ncbi:luciferin 4-monooxygenase-like [Battus philenor]|uniref:luciferin 4-monooxygenase-like n=1 Tax=Battus philenor TaxID=42288 RepID=UPI0035CF3847
MKFHKHSHDAVHWYMNELMCRVVAQTGIVTDKFHVGKLMLQSLKDAPDYVMQIDGNTGEFDTFQSALERSVRCATGFTNMGLKSDDVVIIMGPNHKDLVIPMYAGIYLGIYVHFVDMTLRIKELQDVFENILPKIIFCQSEKVFDIESALENIKFSTKIVTFNTGSKHNSFSEFLNTYGDDTPVEEFQPANFDPSEKTCLLISTSGTTGVPKCAAITHENLSIGLPYLWKMASKYPSPVENALILSPAQWLSTLAQFILSPILRYTRIQTSKQATLEHISFLFNKYKPGFTMMSPTMMTTLMNRAASGECDLSCLKILMIGGSNVPRTLIDNFKKQNVETEVYVVYGFTEISTVVFNAVSTIPGSCGRPYTHLHYRLVDPITKEEVLEANKSGELWVKGPVSFKGYYNKPEVTAEVYTTDGWIRSGDLFYRDENWNFFFVDRLKMLLKYRSHHISPTEVEEVIIKHPGVLDVAVTGIPDEEAGDLAVACVVPRDNYPITAQEIKDLVKETLADTKQLRGGVVFLKELPLTSTSKVNRVMLKKIVKEMKRE